MEVIRHDAVRQKAHGLALEGFAKNRFERAVVGRTLEEPGSLVRPVQDVENHPGGSDARLSSHPGGIAAMGRPRNGLERKEITRSPSPPSEPRCRCVVTNRTP